MKKKIKKFAEGGLNIRDREALNLKNRAALNVKNRESLNVKNRESLNLKNRAALNVDKTSATRDVPFMDKTTTRVGPTVFGGRGTFDYKVKQKGYDSATPIYEQRYARRGRGGDAGRYLPITTPNVNPRAYFVQNNLIGYDATKNVPGVRQETYETPRERLNLNSYDSLQLKKGGAVKGKCRMDGIAIRGKTRARQRSK